MADDIVVDAPQIGTIEQILAAPDIGTKLLYVPEWSCNIKIRGISKREQVDIRKQAQRGNVVDAALLEGLMFIAGVEEPQFSKEHYGQLMLKASGVVDRVLKEILSLSGLDQDDLEGVKISFQG